MHNIGYLKLDKPGWFVKRKFLSVINSDDRSKSFEEVTKTNWEMGTQKFHKEDEMSMIFHKHISPQIKNLGIDFKLRRIWYQVYGANTNSLHDYHHHWTPRTDLSGIYYLKLKDNSIRTQYLHDDTVVFPHVDEGDLVLFDARLVHRSPPNNTKYTKIVVSFNLLTN